MNTLIIVLVLATPAVAQKTDPPAGCPILIQQIHPHWVLGEGDPWGSYLRVVFENTSSKTIAAVRFGVSLVDTLADAHQSVYSYDSDSTVKPGKSSNPKCSDGVYAGYPGQKAGTVVWVEKLRFADNTFFVDDGSHSCGAQVTAAGRLTAPSHPAQIIGGELKEQSLSEKTADAKRNCHVVFEATVDRKISDLTVREEQNVRACQSLGFYE